jgi:hypothetical protein
MSARIALEKCWNHGLREAVARCPECGHPYCRECVVEHDDRVICAGCLAKLTAPSVPRRRVTATPILRGAGALVGLFVAWFIFFSVGRMLLSVPAKYHADTLWKRAMAESFRGEDP